MKITKLVNTTNLSKIKQDAKALKRSSSLTHTEALEVTAKKIGFDNWHQVTQANKPFQSIEQALKHGFIAIYDAKEAEDFHDGQNRFTHEEQYLAESVCHSILYNHIINLKDEDDNIVFKDKMMGEELDQVYEEMSSWFEFFVNNQTDVQLDLKAVLKILESCCFFMPEIIIFKGKLFDTNAIYNTL